MTFFPGVSGNMLSIFGKDGNDSTCLEVERAPISVKMWNKCTPKMGTMVPKMKTTLFYRIFHLKQVSVVSKIF